MRPFRFGVFAVAPHSVEKLLQLAQQAENLGYSSLLVPNHLNYPVSYFSSMLALSFVASVTNRLRIGTYVLNNTFYHPALLAKEAATLDVLSGGRFELGLGAGWLQAENQQTGIPFDAAAERISKLEESVRVLKKLWLEDRVTVQGKYYTITDGNCTPKPIQKKPFTNYDWGWRKKTPQCCC